MGVIETFPWKYTGGKFVLKDISRVDDKIKDSLLKFTVLQGKARNKLKRTVVLPVTQNIVMPGYFGHSQSNPANGEKL